MTIITFLLSFMSGQGNLASIKLMHFSAESVSVSVGAKASQDKKLFPPWANKINKMSLTKI